MRTLYHHPLCPFSRKVRIVLAEKKLEADLVAERFWEKRPEFLELSPSGDLPVLVEEGGTVHREPPLLPAEPEARAEVRRLVGWFDAKFNREVTQNLVGEKVTKRLTQANSEPDSRLIRAGYAAIHQHLDTIVWLTERRTWLAGSQYTLADVTAAAHVSCVDYLGDVPWDAHPGAKDWYARVKSRPAFRSLLNDHLPGFPPPRLYADLDF